jgi:hypothetical protein
MQDLGFPEGTGISPTAVSEPFPLFTEEGIKAMRAEILRDEIFKNYRHSSNIAACQLRGFCPKYVRPDLATWMPEETLDQRLADCYRYAPFIYEAWKSPETLAIMPKVAGIDLVPSMDIEIAHVNISVKSEEEKNDEIESYKSRETSLFNNDNPVVAWHYDCYPFVYVLMLSEASMMIGGETALCTGTGEIMKVRGPQMVCIIFKSSHVCSILILKGPCNCTPRSLHSTSSSSGTRSH